MRLRSLAVVLAMAAKAGAAPAPQAWVTDPWGDQRLASVTLAWTSPDAAGDVSGRVVINRAQPGQTVAGFGASLTESAATVLMTLPEADRAALQRELEG